MSGPWTVILDPPAVANDRAPLALNEGPIRIGPASSGIDWGQSVISAYEAQLQTWGSGVSEFRVPNRTITIPLLLGADDSGSAGFETAMRQLRAKVALFQREGGWLQRSTGGGENLYADIVNASLTLPDVYGETGGVEPNVQLILEALPDFYGDLITLDLVTGTGEITAVLQSGGSQAVIEGDHPGRAQILVTDASGNQQFGLLWAFRSRHYDPAASAALAYPAGTALTPAAGALIGGLAGGRAGEAIEQPGVGTALTKVCSGVFTHIGSYQVIARVYSVNNNVNAVFRWNIGDGIHGLIDGPQVPLPGTSAFYLLNLGQVRIDELPEGVTQWSGGVWGIHPSGGVSLWVDMLYLIPLDESAGQLQGSETNDPVMLSDLPVLLRYDGVSRAISGASYTPVGRVLGDLPRIPPSGMERRPVQLFVKPSRGDLDTHADAATADAFSAVVSYRPSYIFRP